MKPGPFEYLAPRTLPEALSALDSQDRDVRVIAGGQSLVPMMNFRLAQPDLLIDLNGIPELSGIEVRNDGSVRIGATTRHRAVETSEVIREKLPLLNIAVPYIAHVQIRNRGTMGGSLAHADPAAEWPGLCLALDASMVATSHSGPRVIAAEEFALGVLTTSLQPTEILTDVIFPATPPNRSFGFQEISRRHGDFALVGIACTVDFDPQGRVTAARVAIIGADDIPLLSRAATEVIVGHELSEARARQAGHAAAAAVSPRSDLHASSEYRAELIQVLVYRALKQAGARYQSKELA